MAQLGATDPILPLASPILISMPVGFLAIWLISRFDRSNRAALDRAGYLAQRVRSETGIGATGAAKH